MEIAIAVGVVVLFFILLLTWKIWIISPIKHVDGGYKNNITIPHTEPVELYFADVSACSMKVRMCLALAEVKFKPHKMKLPSAGSWETKSRDFLCINPAGTVPVLVHNGHPIHESSEQILYIANNLMPDNSRVILPNDIDERLVNEYWVDKTSWYIGEILEDIESALKRRAGNCIPIISIPSFAAIVGTLSWKTVLNGVLILGATDKQAFNIIFAVLGVHAFKYIPKLTSIVKMGKKALFEHLMELEELLNEKGTIFICGDDVTLADIGWAAILERMDFVGWWDHVDPAVYPYVSRYWQTLRLQPSYKEATRLVLVDETFIVDVKSKIRAWKVQYPWFKNLYE